MTAWLTTIAARMSALVPDHGWAALLLAAAVAALTAALYWLTRRYYR